VGALDLSEQSPQTERQQDQHRSNCYPDKHVALGWRWWFRRIRSARCARAATGHATMPPTSVTNSRRLNRLNSACASPVRGPHCILLQMVYPGQGVCDLLRSAPETHGISGCVQVFGRRQNDLTICFRRPGGRKAPRHEIAAAGGSLAAVITRLKGAYGPRRRPCNERLFADDVGAKQMIVWQRCRDSCRYALTRPLG
jgi:hypothetical protein